MQGPHTSIGFNATHVRPRDGFHRSANAEDRERWREAMRRRQDIAAVVGRWVMPRTNHPGTRPDRGIANFALRMGYGDNRQFGEAVTSEFLFLEYVSPEKFSDIVDRYASRSRNLAGKLTPGGHKELTREKRRELQTYFKGEHADRSAQELELNAQIRRRIFEDPATGLISLKARKDDEEIAPQLDADVTQINRGFEAVGLFRGEADHLRVDDVTFRITVFKIDDEFRGQDILIERPLVPMGRQTFQPLGALDVTKMHEVA